MSDSLSDLDATATAELVRRGEVSPDELLEAAIARIEAHNPRLNAVIHTMYDRARADIAAGLPDGPFRGVPFLVKDLDIVCAGEPHRAGMAFLKRHPWVPREDSYLMTRFREAGLVTLGKTNTPELGILPTTEPHAFGWTRNPWNLEHTTGGSSGGSSAAVAAGLVPIAHATDGGGSIRIPASACGLVGLKPTRGRTSRGPQVGDSRGGLVCEHVVTRSVRDCATMLDWVSGPMPGDPYYAPPPERPFIREVDDEPHALRIGFTYQRLTPDGRMEDSHPDCVDAVLDTVRLLERLGHVCEPSYPDALTEDEYVPRFLNVWCAGVAQDVAHWERITGLEIGEDDVEPLTWALCQTGRQVSAPAYLDSWAWLHRNSRRLAAWFIDHRYDLFLTPTLADPPPRPGEFDAPRGAGIMGILRAAMYAAFTPPINVTGQPAISLPLSRNRDGLPIGSHFVAPYAREDLLLRLGAQLERHRGGWEFPPG